MTIRISILNRHIVPERTEITVKQNGVGDIKCIIPIADFMSDYSSERALRMALKFESIAVYQNDELLRSGIIKDVIMARFGKVDGYFKLTAEDEFGRLVASWSKPDAHYQDVLVTSVLDDLLSIATDWSAGDVSTMDDSLITTTVNLRSKNRLWAQMVEMAESKPKVFLRYGGIDGITGDYLVDMGLFAEKDDSRYAFGDQNVYKVKQKRSPNDLIKSIRPKGGKSGDVVVKLDGTETIITGFPVTLDVPTGEYVVSNSSLTQGATEARTYSHIKTDNAEPPTVAELSETRQSLYEQTVRDLQFADEREVLTLDLVLPEMPKVGQDIWVRSKVEVEAYNILTDAYEFFNFRDVDGYYRITSIKMVYKKDSGVASNLDPFTDLLDDGWIKMKLEVTDGLDLSKYSDTQYLARQMTRGDDSDEPFGAGIGLGGSYVQTVNHTGVATDCTSGAYNGKLFTFPFDPPISGNIRAVGYEVIGFDPDTTEYTVTQEPSLTQPLILCVTGAGPSSWDAGDDTDATIRYTYYT